MEEKKKFGETKVGKFLLEKVPALVGAFAGETVPGKVIQALIGSSELSDNDKAIALAQLEIERAEIDGVTKRWTADTKSGSWLASNVRPLTLVFLTIAFVVGWFMQIQELDIVKGLLQIVFMGYFGSRGFEKIMGNNKHK